MIRVVLAEDQVLVLGALAALLELERDIAVVARAKDGDEALALALEHRPDILVTDIEMPGKSGLEVAAELAAMRQRAGGAGSDAIPTRVVIITTFARAGYLRRALAAGVSGYLLKDTPAERLAEALRRVHGGGRVIDPELAAEAWGEADLLTDRERQVLRAAGKGESTAAIAAALGLAEGTVRNYLSEAIGKLGAANRIEAARLARDRGWL